MPWANGLGTTSVIARWPDDDHWAWRLSLADVVTDGPFSSLPGVDRYIAVASGAGMDLTVDAAAPVRVTRASSVFAFRGDAETSCALIDGPIVDVNLMVRRDRATGSLGVVHLAIGEHIEATTACVVLDGSIGVGGDELHRFDAILDPCRVIALERVRLALVTVHPT